MNRTRMAVLSLLIAAGGLTACGGSDSASGPSGSTPSDPQAAAGMSLSQDSCAGCHSADGSSRSGPTFTGLAGSERTLEDGSVVVADDEYLARAINDPDAQIVDGFRSGIMSSVVRDGDFTDEEVEQLIAYIKTLG